MLGSSLWLEQHHPLSLPLPRSNPDLRRSDPGWERSDSLLPSGSAHLPQAGSLERNRVGGEAALAQPGLRVRRGGAGTAQIACLAGVRSRLPGLPVSVLRSLQDQGLLWAPPPQLPLSWALVFIGWDPLAGRQAGSFSLCALQEGTTVSASLLGKWRLNVLNNEPVSRAVVPNRGAHDPPPGKPEPPCAPLRGAPRQ